MDRPKLNSKLIVRGKAPLCLKTRQQCRGCFGWRNMVQAAHSQPAWQNRPLRCLVTGLTIQYQSTRQAGAKRGTES